MTRRVFPGSKKSLKQFLYMQKADQKMKPQIVDAMGMPAPGQQPQGTINPMAAFYLPWFDRALTHYLTVTSDPADAVNKACTFADAAFARLGFVFKAPFGFEVIPPEEKADEPA